MSVGGRLFYPENVFFSRCTLVWKVQLLLSFSKGPNAFAALQDYKDGICLRCHATQGRASKSPGWKNNGKFGQQQQLHLVSIFLDGRTYSTLDEKDRTTRITQLGPSLHFASLMDAVYSFSSRDQRRARAIVLPDRRY